MTTNIDNRTCGIHGDNTSSGRCASCDAAVAAVKVGDFFRCSWGYDQTNIDFYEVLSRTRWTVKVRQVDTAVVSDHGSAVKVAPVPGSVHRWNGEVMTKRLQLTYNGQVKFKVASYANAYLWDLVPAYETAPGWGH